MYVRILKRVLGFALVGLGIVGIFVPIIQGILLILAGLFLLEIKVEDIKKWIKKLEF